MHGKMNERDPHHQDISESHRLKQTNKKGLGECWKLVVCKETGVKMALDFNLQFYTQSTKYEGKTKVSVDFSDLKK